MSRNRPGQRSPRRRHDEAVTAIEPPGLARLGAEGVALLRLVPLLHVAWLLHESLAADDRRALLEVAHKRGIARTSAAYRLLEEWLDERPSEEFFAGCMLELKSLLATLPPDQQAASKTDLVAYMITLDRLAIDAHSRRAIVGVSKQRSGGRHEVPATAPPRERGREGLG